MSDSHPVSAPGADGEWYRRLRRSVGLTVREESPRFGDFGFSERHLRCVWFDPEFRPSDLRTHRGESVAVDCPGTWNMEAGPDFRGARLRLGGAQRRLAGDVEIHVRPGDWQRHGHRQDSRYRHVIAHVTYFPGILPAAELPSGAVQIALKERLASNPAFAFENLDVTAYPYAPRDRRPPCAQRLTECPAETVVALLEAAGEERLRRRADHLAQEIAVRGAEQVLYEEVMSALGYKQNKVPFRLLARRIPLAALREEAAGDPEKAYALLAGAGGLLPAQNASDWDGATRRQVRRWWDLWWKQRSRWEDAILAEPRWVLAGLRPPNHPRRRLMAAALLFSNPRAWEDTVFPLAQVPAPEWNRAAQAVLDACNAESYWSFRYGFSGAQRAATALVGTARLASMATNVLAPFLAATGRMDPAAWRGVLHHLAPEEENRLGKNTAFALLGHDHNPAVYRTGLRQQGLLQIFYDFCLNAQSGCEACWLPQALAKQADLTPPP